jgi:hypothetical protein
MLLQPAVGRVLDLRWTGAVQGGARAYEASAFRSGFGLMLAWLAVSLVAIAFTRETYCRQASR